MGARARQGLPVAALAGLIAALVLALVAGGHVGARSGAVLPQDPDTPESLRAEAFEAAQWAIVSDAADALAKVSARFAEGDDALGRLAEQRERLIQRRDALERGVESLYAQDTDAARERRRIMSRTYEQTLAELAEVDARIEAEFPAFAELTRPRALTLAETQGLLNPDEALLLVFVNPEATYVWGITSDRIEWARAEDLGEEALAVSVARLRASLTTAGTRADPTLDPALFAGRPVRAYDRAEAHRLYQALIQPVESVFAGRTTLITVASGPLTTLPLAALVTAPPVGEDSGPEALVTTEWLIDRYALATLPSVSSLKALRCHRATEVERHSGCPPRLTPVRNASRAAHPDRLPLIAFGAPVLRGTPEPAARGAPDADGILGPGKLADVEKLRALPDLPGARAELLALGRIYPKGVVRSGAAATETAVRQTDTELLAEARFVVFSTHGLMAGANFAEPGLVMTPPAEATAEDDGYLTASEAAQLRLSADFVVLSACNTAASDGRPGGQGLSGLARAFFHAGARSLLVSHWEVSDQATTALITGTFTGLDRTPGNRAVALQGAMLEVRADRRWQHPAYWAAFTLVGTPS